MGVVYGRKTQFQVVEVLGDRQCLTDRHTGHHLLGEQLHQSFGVSNAHRVAKAKAGIADVGRTLLGVGLRPVAPGPPADCSVPIATSDTLRPELQPMV